MEKLLTISIAAYQVEKYIRQTLDSLLIGKEMECLEVFVVDDGGKDSTLSIAKEYEKKYPGVFHAIHKTNGGYGSTVNYSIQHATGKFFKLLDGDDWFDKAGLRKLIKILSTTDADAIINPYASGPDENGLSVMERTWKKFYGKEIFVEELNNEHIPMWCLTYRTDCIRKSDLELPEHTLYSDYIYDIVPFSYVNKVLFDSNIVYCYRTGRDGQSVSRESRIKHYKDIVRVSLYTCEYANSIDSQCKAKQYIEYRCAGACRYAISSILMINPPSESKRILVEYESEVSKVNERVYHKITSVGKFGIVILLLRITKYLPLPVVKRIL